VIDSHCHLTDERLEVQLADVLARAKAAGVGRIVSVGTTPADGRRVAEIAARHGEIRGSVGIHPNHSQEFEVADVGEVFEVANSGAVNAAGEKVFVALGEMGLDYFHKYAPREHQRAVFEAQLQLAKDGGWPVIIHSREAVTDTLAVLANFPAVRCVFHCFTGKAEEARAILDAGHLLGFTGAVTYKKNDELRRIAAECPADRLLIETDAPYLSPEPVRNIKTNEPAFVAHVARCIATARGMSLEELDVMTEGNTKRFYRW
jgi:TatD DNase family protein